MNISVTTHRLVLGATAAGAGAAVVMLVCKHFARLIMVEEPKIAPDERRRPMPPPANAPAPDSTPKTVRAYAAMKPREPMVPHTYELPSTAPPPGFVDLDITHCGMCHSDVHQIDDAWKAASFPLIPGHEIVGTISAVSEDAESRAKFAVGDRACIGVQRGCCGQCEMCHSHLENVCPKILKTYAGPGKDKGGFATMIRFPTAWVFKAPAGLESEYLGPLMCAGITTYSPLKRFGRPGSKVGIIGIGGLGHIGLQFAAAMGFSEVVAISRSPSKEAEARKFGATSFLVTEDATAMADAASSFDMILNTVSGHAPIDPYLNLIKPRGTLACVGLPEKDQKSQMWFQSMVPQERALVGSYLGPYADYEEMLAFATAHNVKPQIELFPAQQINEAITKVRNNTARYRIVLEMNPVMA
uniref:Prephenate dehydratase domain-containing protein n=1 Tax=Haptolina brevifila TaxID=156173 RepID=A0A7S2DML8_9EUKA|mmetsp:Transcript_41219/g.82599  ORF Transcript_41219/g.82599 Transcript_41219/m.82599 type:complete len:414 (+) Transcript_41219:101-1342(+)